MARPCKKYPKRNVVSFRLTDPELAALRFYAEQVARPGESFNDTIGRYIKNAIMKGAEKMYAEHKMLIWETSVVVGTTQEDNDLRRKQYRKVITEFRHLAGKAYQEGQQSAPARLEFGGPDSPSVVAVARPEATTHAESGAGQSDWKNTDFSTDRNFPARENCLQENSQNFPKTRENPDFSQEAN